MKIALRLGLLLLLHIAWSGPLAGAEAPGPQRAISMGPNITETVFMLGAGKRLVGVSEFCRWPAEVNQLKRCGGLLNPNLETIRSLDPDLILIQFGNPALEEFARSRSIPLKQVKMDSLQSIQEGILELGNVFGCRDRATSLTLSIDKEMEGLKDELATKGITKEQYPKVFLSIGRSVGSLGDITTASSKSFLGEALRLAGGANVFDDLSQSYAQVSKESIVARRPQIILEIQAGADLTPRHRQMFLDGWQALPSIPAVQTGRIAVLTESYLEVPGPRLPQIVRALRQAIYPDLERR